MNESSLEIDADDDINVISLKDGPKRKQTKSPQIRGNTYLKDKTLICLTFTSTTEDEKDK